MMLEHDETLETCILHVQQMNTPQCGPKGRRSADFDPANTDQASDFGSDWPFWSEEDSENA
jgi:hypothetical protein